jgi:hypothetical protein
MATRRGIAPHDVGVRTQATAHAEARALTAEQTAWLALLPALTLAIALIALLAPPLGHLLPETPYTYWPSLQGALRPKPTELARFGLAIVAALTFAAVLPAAVRHAPRLQAERARALVLVAQLTGVALLAVCWFAQHTVEPYDTADPEYFTWPAVVVSVAFAALATAVLAQPRTIARVRVALAGARWPRACLAAAVLVTIAWLLPSILTDANVVFANHVSAAHAQFTYDEAMSVLDGRSPLVDMATYGSLVPYLIAVPLAAFGGSLAGFTVLMIALSSAAFVAIYALLRRLTRHGLAALALYIPFLATSLFLVRGNSVERFTFANYFGMFPVRYAGPYILAWLTVRQLDGARPRSPIALFGVAGLVMLNNTDFGLAALAATIGAVLCGQPPRDRRSLLSFAGRITAGLAIALALVSVLTLARAGTLPHLGRVFAYARLFGLSGYENLPTPLLGFHLVILATYVAALATASVQIVRRDASPALTGMLAWCGLFGLGTGGYFVYRSHPDTLIATFSIWSLTLAVLLIAHVRGTLRIGSSRPSPAALALLIGVGLTICSLRQFPFPWTQVERIARTSNVRLLEWESATRFVAQNAPRGTTAAILTPLGHRIGYETGVRNVMGYAGMTQMPTVEQLQETIDALRAAGGRSIFLGEQHPPEVPAALERAGFRLVANDLASGFTLWSDGG